MRLANLAGRAALVVGADVYDLATASEGTLPPDPMDTLGHLDAMGRLDLTGRPPTTSLDAAPLGPPVPEPRQVFAVGLNYRAHAAEAEMEVPRYPLVFTKFPSCITGPFADVHLRSDRCDYEGELVVVIGRTAKDLDPGHALAHVAGFMVGQDISDRRTQFSSKPPQFALGKSFDTFGPTGPVLVTPDEVQLDALRLRTWINDEERQNDVVSSMMFAVPTLVAYLSRVTTLHPGDLVFTGTPEGVGAMDRRYLADGDVVRTSIDGLGTIENRCVRVEDHGLAEVVGAA